MDSNCLNPGIPFDSSLIEINSISDEQMKTSAGELISRADKLKGKDEIEWLAKAVTCIDLTTLAGDDTETNVAQLCHKALNPIPRDVLEKLNLGASMRCGAICVYPARVQDAYAVIQAEKSDLPIASVAAGFPHGQTTLRTKLVEIEDAVAAGATEIDIVISRRHALKHDWTALYDELKELRKACGKAHMKTILAVGELSNFTEVYQASMIAMMAGSDFIKTSTGTKHTYYKSSTNMQKREVIDFVKCKSQCCHPTQYELLGYYEILSYARKCSKFRAKISQIFPQDLESPQPAILYIQHADQWWDMLERAKLGYALNLKEEIERLRGKCVLLLTSGLPSSALPVDNPLKEVIGTAERTAKAIFDGNDDGCWSTPHYGPKELRKEAVNATLPVGLVMCEAIKEYEKKTGFKVGLKPAGGLRTCQDAINWLTLVKEKLGDEWLNPTLFRIGASGLLTDIEKQLCKLALG